ncbi:MAG: ABC transporter permease [Acidobacteria bacterium]|nr:ABC transporter permease [Acidobacteriota bacterium]
MLSPRWKKLLGDLRSAASRFAMMAAAIAVSTAAVGAILSSYAILTREVSRNYLGTNPASAQLEFSAADDSLVRKILTRPGIADAEAGSTVLARIEVAPSQWLPLMLFVVPGFDRLRINAFRPESGAWPPPEGSLLIERTALPLTRTQVSKPISVQTSNGQKRSLSISGLVHDPGLAPAWQEQTVYGYLTPATLRALGESGDLHLVKIVVRDNAGSLRAIEDTARRLATWLGEQGWPVEEIRIPPPRMHPHQSQMMAILVMLLIFSLLALVLGAILAATIISGFLAQQVRQIAIMKAIGARSRQIAFLYAGLIAALGAASVALGLPLGLAAGRGFSSLAARLLNLNIYSYSVPWWVWAADLLLGVAVPLGVALVPILGAVRRTIRDAINDYGVDKQSVGASMIDRLLARFRNPDPALSMAVRNTFRRRARLALTLALLATAGAMFITSLNLKAAWEKNLADARADRHYQVEVRLENAVPESKAAALVGAIPGVERVESWNILPAAVDSPGHFTIVRTYPDGGHGSFTLRSAPPQTDFIAHRVQEGRWLRPGDTDAVVLNHMALALLPNVKVGDVISLIVEQRLVQVRVVGILREMLTPAAAYATPEGFAIAAGQAGLTNAVRVALKDARAVDSVSRSIEQALARERVAVKVSITESRFDEAQTGHVYILVFALIFMALVMAVVGSLGLASAMSAGVVERTREFGVMRAIGATSRVVLRNVVSEGVFTGLLSWLIAIPLSLPLSTQVGNLVGSLSFRVPLPLFLSPGALGIWLLVVLAVSAVASAFPAQRAARLTIRETLAYV